MRPGFSVEGRRAGEQLAGEQLAGGQLADADTNWRVYIKPYRALYLVASRSIRVCGQRRY